MDARVWLNTAVVDSFFASNDSNDPIPLENACTIVCLSTKYDLPVFRTKSISELKKYFPATLAVYDAVPIRARAFTLNSSQLKLAICTAHETNVLEILPCAFYHLCRLSLKALFDAPSNAQCLRPGDLEVCVLGRKFL